MSGFGHAVEVWLAHYGYAGVALGVVLESAGLPVPGEAAVLAAGFSAARGTLSLPVVMAVAATAGILGDNLGYWVGRRLGRPWLERNGRWVLLNPARLQRVDRFFARFGPAAIGLARFVAGVRVIAAVFAGVSGMRWRTFALFNVLGAIPWAVITTLEGYFFGVGWGALGRRFGPLGLVVFALLPLVVLTAWIFWGFRKHAFTGEGDRWWDRLAWQWVWIAALSLGAVTIFGLVSEDVSAQETLPFDLPVQRWFLAHHAPVLDFLFALITRAGSPLVMGVAALLAGGALLRVRGLRVAAATALAPLVALGLIAGFKLLFSPVRPLGAAAARAGSFSFPSGHATATTAVALTLAYVLWREEIAPAWSLGVAALLALLVGASRVYLDVHWATDVIGGWGVGLFVATVCASLYERLRPAALAEGTPSPGESLAP